MSVVVCPACRQRCHGDDAACGACGAALAKLVVVEGRRRVDATTTVVDVAVENTGVVPAAFVLRRIDARAFPAWLVGGPTLDEAITIAPGARAAIRFSLDPTRLASSGIARVVVPLVTSIIRFDPQRQRVLRRVLAVELATAGHATVTPTHALVPFIARERLVEGFTHSLTVRNVGGHALTIEAADIDLDAAVVAAQWASPIVGTVVGPGASVTFALSITSSTAPASMTTTTLQTRLRFDDGSTARAQVQLTIGRGPDVVVVDNPVVATRGRSRRGQLVLENPGERAVEVRASVVGEDVDGHWFVLDDAAPIVIGAGQRHGLGFVVLPEERALSALAAPWGERTVRLTHDGWPSDAADRVVEVTIAADLGRTKLLEEATLGVDFGTSSSSVSMFHGSTGTLHALPLDRASGREALASLLFFAGDGARNDTAGVVGVDGFLVGAAAENAAPQNYTNLVRQLKSVVARAPDTMWHFVSDDARHHRTTMTTPALLTRYFGELKRRAEDGLRALPLSLLAELDLVDTGVRFSHAVFSHPVGADDAMLRALHGAAVDSGLTSLPFHAFKAERCIDEALAAVLAFVYLSASLPAADIAVVDDERLLCFDAGGGTCDVAAVSIGGLASFRRNPGHGVVDVELLANGGDPRFGGTDIDRQLASFLLDEAARRPAFADVDIEALRRALYYPSYEAWRRARSDGDGRARALFHRSSDVLRAAERLKKTLSEAPSASFIVNLDEWPRVAGRTAPSASPATNRLELDVRREQLEALCAPMFEAAAALIDPVLDATGWRADDVTTLLFTGQTAKIPALRKAVIGRLQARRSSSAVPLLVIEPGRIAAFDVKRCVAQGAAILGDSRRGGGGWLRVRRRSQHALSAPLQVRRGPLLVDVAGLAAGAPLPARGVVALGAPGTRLVLYRAGTPAFELSWEAPADSVDIVVEAEGDVVGTIGGVTTTTRRLS